MGLIQAQWLQLQCLWVVISWFCGLYSGVLNSSGFYNTSVRFPETLQSTDTEKLDKEKRSREYAQFFWGKGKQNRFCGWIGSGWGSEQEGSGWEGHNQERIWRETTGISEVCSNPWWKQMQRPHSNSQSPYFQDMNALTIKFNITWYMT